MAIVLNKIMSDYNFHIRTLCNYKDWFSKAVHDFQRYKETYGVYELADCLLTLNALPEWIVKSIEAPESLKDIAGSKILIMTDHNAFVFDENKLNGDIDQKLRFIRIFCNHSKHAVPKNKFPKIEMSATLPAALPIKFENISVGNSYFRAEDILLDVIKFWTKSIEEAV
ncbi:MAG: hypothetical protein WKF97_23900 [Chitinophagaceae bacterium]